MTLPHCVHGTSRATKQAERHFFFFNDAYLTHSSELCESRGGRPGVPVPKGFCGRKATLKLNYTAQSCVKVEVAVLGSPSLRVSVDVKQH